MLLWDQSVEILRESMLAYAQVCNGNLGYGILIVTFLARLALLPLGLRLARLAHAHQQAMQKIQPELDALRRTYQRNPRRLAEVALYAAVRQVAGIGGRFLWVRDISRPDVVVGVLATLLTVAATASGSAGPAPNRAIILLMSAVLTAVALSKMAAGVGLYWGLSSLIGAVQGLVIQRRARAAA